MITEKNTAPEEDDFYEYAYYIGRIKQWFITTKRRWFKAQYPHHRFIIEELDNANSIHAFNRFEEKGHVECPLYLDHTCHTGIKSFFFRSGTVVRTGLVQFS